MKILQLSTAVANQIAAGEVIERPASVVKELLENALDAKADHIIIDLSFAGMNAIAVSDNGLGITEADLPLAIAPHATSKIRSLDDLASVVTMGFRGEALASIASVSQFTLQSKPVDQSRAMQLTVKDQVVTVTPCAHKVGTTVMVKDLFYNTPVRKRFLSSERTEFLAIDRLVRCFALSAPEVKIDFYHQGQVVLELPKGTTPTLRLQRIRKILGKTFIEAAIPIETQHLGLKIEGWIAGPDYGRSQQDRIWTYVNRRMVNDKLLNHAIKQAYEGRLHAGRYPACLIYIEINPEEVDVNVHPTKHELRFHQPRWIHDALRGVIEAALQVPNNAALEPLAFPKDSVTTGQPPTPSVALKGSAFHWVTITADFALLLRGPDPFLLHIKRFQYAYLKAQLSQSSLPLATRSLFVPVRIPLNTNEVVVEDTLVCLAQAGLTLSWMGDSVLLVRSIPVLVPHLHLRPFIQKILSCENVTVAQVLEALVEHQGVDASSLSDMEKQSWLGFLAASTPDEVAHFLKPLSSETCSVMFHA